MIEQLKQWFILSATVVIHVGSGRKQVFHKKKFTMGYGSINTWNLDSEKPHASLLVFKKTKSSLEVTPANPDDTLLLDGKPWMGEVLAKETDYTLQRRDEQFLLCHTEQPKAWLKRIQLDRWLAFEPATGEIFGPLDKLQLEPWVIAERKDPEELS
jgi:hypothetical protein